MRRRPRAPKRVSVARTAGVEGGGELAGRKRRGPGGFAVSIEALVLATCLLCVLVAFCGVVTAKLVAEAQDVAAALGALDQGYRVSGVAVGHPNDPTHPQDVALWPGSEFVDTRDPGDPPAMRLLGFALPVDGGPGDACPGTRAGAPVDPSGCSIPQLCPCDGPAGGGPWGNHGEYVSCVAHAAERFQELGMIPAQEKDRIVSAAGRSSCGKKSGR